MKKLYMIPEDIWPYILDYFNWQVPNVTTRNGKHYVSQEWLNQYEKKIDNFILSEVCWDYQQELFE